jgi:hypothetical protein
MAIVTVEAFRVPIGFPPGCDHTYVAQSTQGSPPPDYFACWGQSYARSNYPPVCTGNVNYNLANCYRDSVFLPWGEYPDTAAIGVYGVNGVCHQSANCFLLSANVQLNFSVGGYWASLLAYGPLGTNALWWLGFVYGVCSMFNPAIAAEMPEAAAAEPSVVDKLRDLYASFRTQPQPPDSHEVIIREAATVVKHFEPDVDPSGYRDLHARFLDEKDAAIATGVTGQPLADKLNSLSKQLQEELAHRLDPAHYKKLSGVEPGQTLDLCDHRLAAATGVPVPPFKRG